jgi:hypothetical protein
MGGPARRRRATAARRWSLTRLTRPAILICGVLPAVLICIAAGPPAAGAATVPPIVSRIFEHACGTPSIGHAACDAIVVENQSGGTASSQLAAPAGGPLAGPAAAPSGYGPADLRSAYNLASAAAANGGNETVALVDAYDDPDAASDLATYRSTYGLPACGTGCFRKVNQTGGTSYPTGNTGWSEEISLDLDMVSAICPNCRILLVEASSDSLTSLGAAVNEAASLGATQISNSYGGSETSNEGSLSATYYNHPGIDVTVSSGDSGFGVEFPAASQYVTAVGGTSLSRASNARGWTETAWSGAGSGCSVYIPKPSYQKDTGCANRTVADVSAVADPGTPVAVYDTYGGSGWMEFGGTSVASPIIASVDALAGGRSPGTTYGDYAYAHPSQFNDIVSGSNWSSCPGSYECEAMPGYDGPTGIGTPDGAGPVGPPPPVPVNTGLPTISGSLVGGQTLTATNGSWQNSPTSYAYQWEDCTSSLTSSCTALVGAINQTYTLPTGYTGFVTVAVTASNAGGPSTPATATPRGPIAAPPPSFTLSATPASQSVSAGSSATYSVTVTPANAFTGSVAFTASGLPAGVTAAFSPAASPTGSTLTLKSSTTSPTGAHTITIGGSSAGAPSASTTVSLTLTSGTCFFGFCF